MDQWNLLLKEPIEGNGHWEEVSTTSLKVSTPDQISIGALTMTSAWYKGGTEGEGIAHTRLGCLAILQKLCLDL